jgi:hypothetical protein
VCRVSGRMPRVTRLRSTVALIVLVLVVGMLAGVSLADPFHLRYARWFTAGLVGLALVLLTAAFAVVTRRGLLRGLALLVGFFVVLGWAGFVFGASRLAGTNQELTRVSAGGRSLVVLQGSGATLDPVYAVVLRAGSGPFEQESLVYQGQESGPPPLAVRFVDGGTVEVLTRGGCQYRSQVEGVTLAVDPVHRPLQPDVC